MKWVLLALLVPFFAKSQEYKSYSDFMYLKDTLLINGVKIKKGDTLRLGSGSSADNSFLYVYTKPTLMNGANTKPLPNKYNNGFLILGEMKETSMSGHAFIFPTFLVNGDKSRKVYVNFSKAIESKEILF